MKHLAFTHLSLESYVSNILADITNFKIYFYFQVRIFASWKDWSGSRYGIKQSTKLSQIAFLLNRNILICQNMRFACILQRFLLISRYIFGNFHTYGSGLNYDTCKIMTLFVDAQKLFRNALELLMYSIHDAIHDKFKSISERFGTICGKCHNSSHYPT